MPQSGSLELSRSVSLGSVELQTSAEYIAIRSESPDAIPYIAWTVLKVANTNIPSSRKPDTIAINTNEFGLRYVKPNTRVLWEPVDPVRISRVILTAPPAVYKQLSQSKDSLKRELPSFLKAGSYIQSLGCHVKALEPADEGIVDPESSELSIAVVEIPDNSLKNGHSVHDSSTIDIEPFLLEPSTQRTLKLEVSPLRRPVPMSSIMPPIPDFIDTENLALVKLSQLAKLGVFSGDMVKLESETTGKSRLVYLYSYPEPNTALDSAIYIPPLLAYNLGSPLQVTLTATTPESWEHPFESAKDVVLSRVSSPASTDKANQSAFLRGLKTYFGNGRVRVVKNGDLIPVPINSAFARLLGPGTSSSGGGGSGNNNGAAASNSNSPSSGGAHTVEDIGLDLQTLHDEVSTVDTMIWFQVDGLPSDNEYMISAAHTRIVQSGLIQRLAPPSSLKWQSYWGLPVHFNYLEDPQLFSYAHKLHKLLRAALTLRSSAATTVMLKSSKFGAGKSTLLKSLAADLGIHEMALDALDLIGDSDGKTLALLKSRLERAATSAPCVVTIKHFEMLARKSDVDGKDTPLVNGLVDILDELLNGDIGREHASSAGGFILAATVRDPDSLADSVRNKFKFEIDVTVPTEAERRSILTYLTSDEGGFGSLGQLRPKFDAELFTRYQLRGDVAVSSLALQSAGLTPPDLLAIIRSAKQLASTHATKDLVLSSRGTIKLTPQDLDAAIREARDNFSDSIGAPKIPNVGWKDVGGLDMVKGEILDTIDMPLKHPELFSSGLKKRSGILFYGPPGTGKTLLAKAIATNFSLNFFSVKGPELLNMYIGESEANVRRVFQKARDAKPCVVFFDELDSVAPKRGNKGDSGGVMDRIVSQLLAELDGMSEGSDGVFVVGATNRPDLLDEALLRPGRFDKLLYLGISDTHEKQRKILEALTRKFDLDPKVDLSQVAENCPFTYTGADFYAMSSDAMLNAMTRTAGEVDAKIAKYNREHPDSPVSIRRWFQSVATPEDTKVMVSMADFAKAQKELVPSVSADELAHYLRVRDTFEGNV